MKKNFVIAALAVALIISLSLSACAASRSAAAPASLPVGAQFRTPDAAINAYFDGLKANDVDKILAASAIDEQSEGFEFKAMAERIKAMPLISMPMPADNAFFKDINRQTLSSDILRQVKFFSYGLLSNEKQLDQTIVLSDGMQRVDDFVRSLDPKRLAKLRITTIAPPALQNDQRNLANMERLALIYGADEMVDRLVLFVFEGKQYYMGFQLARYGQNWKVLHANSPLGDTSPLGVPKQVTREEFDKLIERK